MIHILVVDDHSLVRVGFRHLIEALGDYLVFEASSGEEAYQIYPECKPDAVIMDVAMPGYGGLEATRRICARDPQARVIMLSAHDSPVFVARAEEAGARAYLAKHAAPAQLGETIQRVLADEVVFDEYGLRRDADQLIKSLSAREFEIFRLLAEGASTASIGTMLNISPKTVSNHRSAVFEKLQVDNLAALSRVAIRGSVIDAGFVIEL